MNIQKVIHDLKLIFEENQQPVYLEYAIEKWLEELESDYSKNVEKECRESFDEGYEEAEDRFKEEIEELKNKLGEIRRIADD